MKKTRWEYFGIGIEEHVDIAIEVYRAVNESKNEGELLEKLKLEKDDYRAYLAGFFMALSLNPNSYQILKQIYDDDQRTLEILEYGECAKEYLKKIANQANKLVGWGKIWM